MPTTLSTEIVIAAAVVILLAYDAWALVTQKNEHTTISVVLRDLALRRPVIPFLFGLLMGHLFWLNCA